MKDKVTSLCLNQLTRYQSNIGLVFAFFLIIVTSSGAAAGALGIGTSPSSEAHVATEKLGGLISGRSVETHSGKIKSSFLRSTTTKGIPNKIAWQFISIFKDRINFSSDLRSGDYFRVTYETFRKDGHPLRVGRVLVAEIEKKGGKLEAAWFVNSADGGGEYYDFDGHSLKRSFLRSPLVFTRISSPFSMRVHPILGKWKKHSGVDFAAASGTPIHATSDGTIKFAGVKNGYGKVVIITHGHKYSTLYAHMSRFSSRSYKDNRVRQGDVIGYVGMTGWATGPHLHYEFRENNRPRDPLSIAIHAKKLLKGEALHRFRESVAGLVSQSSYPKK